MGKIKEIVKRHIPENSILYDIFWSYRDLFKNSPINAYISAQNVEVKELRNGPEGSKESIAIIDPGINGLLGTFEMWFSVAYRVMLAEKRGWIPIIDFKNYDYPHWDKVYMEKCPNKWECFFEQYPSDWRLEDIHNSRNVFRLLNYERGGYDSFFDSYSERQRQAFHTIYQTIPIRKGIIDKANQIHIPPKTLGVTIRRSFEWGNKIHKKLYNDYKIHHTRGHIDLWADWLERNLYRLGFDSFFLCTDDRETKEFFVNRFSDVCLFYDRKQKHFFERGLPIPIGDQRIDVELSQTGTYEIEEGYIIETILLSKCDSILRNSLGQEHMARVISERSIPLIETGIYLDMYERRGI